MIDVKAEIARVETRVKGSCTPHTVYRIAWIETLNKHDHCDDIRTALDTLCTRLINRFCKSGTTKSELLAPILEEIRQTKKELQQRLY